FGQENRGIPASRNEAIRRSRGRYLAFLDQDDLWHPEKLRRQVPLFDESPRVGLVHCQCARVDERSRPLSGGPVVLRGRMSGDVRRGMLVGNIVPGTAGAVVRRECFDDVGLFDETLNGSDDWEMWARIATRWEFRYVPEALSYTRLHPANTSTDVARMRADSIQVHRRLFSDPGMTGGIGPRELRRLRRRGRARIHSYCATWLIRTGRVREAVVDLARAVRYDPMKPRHLLLLLLSALGWVPGPVHRRLV
ncbi:MAG: glycosyltransferase, partial [Planctomycetota bacterium]